MMTRIVKAQLINHSDILIELSNHILSDNCGLYTSHGRINKLQICSEIQCRVNKYRAMRFKEDLFRGLT